MEWQSEVEKEFKLKYANAYTELTPGYILQSIESRLNDVELAFKHKSISEDVYNKSKSELLERKKWVEEVDAEWNIVRLEKRVQRRKGSSSVVRC